MILTLRLKRHEAALWHLETLLRRRATILSVRYTRTDLIAIYKA